MNSSSFYLKRLQDLEDNINQEFVLLKDWEDGLRHKTNLTLKEKYLQNIKERRSYIAQYEQEYEKLRQQLNSSPSLQTSNVESQFQQINEQLNILRIDQRAMADDLNQTRQVLLSRYDFTEQRVIGEITQQLDQFQLALTQKLLYAIDANLVSEQQMQQMLAVVEQRLPCLPPSQAETVAQIVKDPEMDVKHRLKVALPIVPMLVEYEGEVELGSGFNIKSVWEQVVAKLWRKPKRIGKPLGNYTKLRELLEAGKWRDADLETAKIILEIAGRQKQGWLRTEDIKQFPALDRQIIDNLWVKLSQHRFGFSVQREIWLSISNQLGGEFDGNLFPEFGEDVGWYRDNKWLEYEELAFNLNAPEGHLPSFPITDIKHKDDLGLRKADFKNFLSQIGTC